MSVFLFRLTAVTDATEGSCPFRRIFAHSDCGRVARNTQCALVQLNAFFFVLNINVIRSNGQVLEIPLATCGTLPWKNTKRFGRGRIAAMMSGGGCWVRKTVSPDQLGSQVGLE